jgi:hypothetical protein
LTLQNAQSNVNQKRVNNRLPKLTKSFSVKKAHNTQVCLSKKLILEDVLPKKIKTVGGVDVSYVANIGIGARNSFGLQFVGAFGSPSCNLPSKNAVYPNVVVV